MNNFNRINIQRTVLIVLLTFSFMAVAQNKKIIFSNNNEQAEINGNASINITSGDITVQTVGTKYIVDGQAGAILGFYPNTYSISPPSSVTVNWASAYSSGCSAEVTSGNATNWAGSKTPNVMANETVTVSTVPTTLKLECDNLSGSGSVTKTFTISQKQTGGTQTNPIAINFQFVGIPGLNPNIVGDGNYPLMWSTSNATSCSASSSPNIPGWTSNSSIGLFNNSYNLSITGSPSLTLTCTDGVNQKSVTLNVSNGNNNGGGSNPPLGCSNVITPPGMTATSFNFTDNKPPGTGAATPGQHGYGAPFMDMGNYGVVFNHKEGSEYISISNLEIPTSHSNFKNGHLEAAKILFNDGGTAGGVFNRAIISMSECPGDFKTTQTAACLVEVIKGSKMYITTDSNGIYANALPNLTCVVEKGKTYYLNFFSGANKQAVDNSSLRGCTNPYGGRCAATISVGKEL